MTWSWKILITSLIYSNAGSKPMCKNTEIHPVQNKNDWLITWLINNLHRLSSNAYRETAVTKRHEVHALYGKPGCIRNWVLEQCIADDAVVQHYEHTERSERSLQLTPHALGIQVWDYDPTHGQPRALMSEHIENSWLTISIFAKIHEFNDRIFHIC